MELRSDYSWKGRLGMSRLPRITPQQASEVDRLLKAGKPKRQVERIVGLTYGILDGRYTVAEDQRPYTDEQIRGRPWIYPGKPKDEDKS